MSSILTANRVTALATWLTGLGGLTAGGLGVFPHAWQNGAVAVAGLLTKLGTAVTFLIGSQRSEALHQWDYSLPAVQAPAPELEVSDAEEFAAAPSEGEAV